ncbi:response regulator [Echinicola vietnamensis]|uniref:Response regulator with CheY-like receiver, AAA-type ATPase, and DNA-binding domains n=1 Tax=Echinicola vietnamensis (strain DSM 17526 / LMG 23754 / KMM 6221) TaxID=926556 RepID=L0FTX8_ECHVK|nr:response regulator [Echinicola vietnamensis]AGA77359.1 response regulator with CheY-like receiver, AAA-type ATPase, and DNA-binding domains [Echinicola vietnamensis DSM 17526]
MNKKIKCVLLVDDDEPTNFINEIILKRTGLVEKIVPVQSGMAALEYINKAGGSDYPRPELIFLDINMPGISGWDFLEEYKKLPQHLKAKNVIVMLTTSLNPDDDAKAKTYQEISEYRSKPLTYEKITEIIEKHFAD